MEKAEVVSELRDNFSKAPAAFLFEYTRCTCAELTTLRRKLKQSGASMRVVKNTLASRAVAETSAAVLDDLFVGQTAVIWSGGDFVQPAKLLNDFAKEKEDLKIKGGVVEGKLVGAQDIEALAKMPSREEILSKLLALINAPATRLLQTINAPASSMVRLLGAVKDKLEKSA